VTIEPIGKTEEEVQCGRMNLIGPSVNLRGLGSDSSPEERPMILGDRPVTRMMMTVPYVDHVEAG